MTRFFHLDSKTILITAITLLLLYFLVVGQDNNWVKHEDPLGFSIKHPPGWKVNVSEGRIEVFSPDMGTGAIIKPFIQEPAMKASDYVSNFASGLGGKIYPGSEKQRSNVPGLDEISAVINWESSGTSFKMGVLGSIYQRSGMIFAIIAPENQFEAKKATMIQVLQTLKFDQPSMEKNQPSPQADEGINYIQWREPNEGAYTVEVPSRWTITGGIERYPKGHIVSLEGGRSILKAISPDGNVVITIGDINVPNFNTPTQVSQMSGFGEGSFMGEYMIMPYVIGTQFAEFYITNMLAQEFDYTNLNIIHRQDLPEMSKAINDNYVRYGLPIRLDCGEVFFDCQKNGEMLKGHYIAGTEFASLMTEPGAGLWSVPRLLGYVASPSQESLANAVMAHMISSSQYNTNWLSRESKNAIAEAEINRNTNEEISNMITETYNTRSQTQSEISRKWENAFLGYADIKDENTGETWKVYGGHNYYWGKAGTDTIIGTDTPDRPDIDFTPLQEL